VDFPRLAAQLQDGTGWQDLLADWKSGRVKQALIRALLARRRQDPGLFEQGGYQALEVTGAPSDHVLAFARTHRQRALLVIVPTLVGELSGEPPMADGHRLLQNVRLNLPEDLRGHHLQNALAATATAAKAGSGLAPGDFLDALPVLVLIAEP
jgi:(1->4)-alpha-D-glucan 1-alpha-D-glucosylmutase